MALRQRSISKRDIGVGPEQGDLEYGRAPRRSTETVLESCSYDLEVPIASCLSAADVLVLHLRMAR